MQSLVGRMFLKRPKVQTAVNAFLINTGAPLVLVDAGGAKQFGPTLGNIVDKLRAAGYNPVHDVAQFVKPDVAIEFDVDKKEAVASRKALFARAARAARERLLVGGMHLPFPGVGHVRREPRGFAWVPVKYGPIPEHVKSRAH